MRNKKQYSFLFGNPSGHGTSVINYNYEPRYRKWTFEHSGNEFIIPCPGGIETAEKIASVIAGAIRRTGNGMDGLGRSQVKRLTETKETRVLTAEGFYTGE